MNKSVNKILGNQLLAKILFIVAGFIIVACVVSVLLFAYEPNQNALGALASVCMDIVCMVVLMVLAGNHVFEGYGMKRTAKLFFALELATIWALFLDFLNWAYDGSLSFDNHTYLFTIGSLCMGSIMACFFSVYLYFFMEEMHGLTHMYGIAKLCAGLNLISFLMTFVLALTRTAFDFVDGHYQVGALYDVVTAIPILTLLVLTVYVVRYVKVIGWHDVLAVCGYILFMITGALIETSFSIGTTFVSIAIANVFIFVMLQNRIIEEERRNVEKWIEKSNTDELTGCHNRHAYEDEMSTLEEGTIPENFVYVSIDVNGLKQVNDSLGHVAGDELIVGASECLKQCFGAYGKLYRTGGDEFAALIFADNIQLEGIKKDVVEVTKQWSGKMAENLAISCGYVTRREALQMSVRQMAVLADERMYEDKAKYYRQAGIERRG